MKCPQCTIENVEGKNFCSDCGAPLTPQLIPAVRTQIETYIKEHFKGQELVDVSTTELITKRFVRWGKWFFFPATILYALLGFTLGFFGVRDYSDVHKAAEHAVVESNEATQKAREAESTSTAAIKVINDVTGKMTTQLTSTQKLSDKVSGLEKKTSDQIAEANSHIESQVKELDKKVDAANRAIAEQQVKLATTNERVNTAISSRVKFETFQTNQGNTTTFATVPMRPILESNSTKPENQTAVFVLLKVAPMQTFVQFHHPSVHYPSNFFGPPSFIGNVVKTILFGDAEGLTQSPLVVEYVTDPNYNGVMYKTLSVKNKNIFADDVQLAP